MIFEDGLVQKGETGGKEAAGLLWTAVRDYVRLNMPDLSSDYKIVTRLYANLKGLGETFRKAGIVEDSSIVENFARGFTGSKQLFDFVDVGSGKDRADEKISGKPMHQNRGCNQLIHSSIATLQLNLSNVHCRHILFGCSHDNGYARLLEDIAQEPDAGKISLLEGVPFERELAQFKSTFGAIKFDNLFRSSKIYAYQQYHPQPYGNYTSIPSLPSPQATNAVPNGINGQQAPTNFASGHTQGLARTPSSSTSESNPAQPTSWATKAMSAPAFQPPAPPPSSQPQPPTIPRNKYGQRIDPLLKMDPTEFKRVQKIKMCNVHFIRRDCPFGDDCTHVHSYKPSKSELDILKQVARSTPCRFGTDCDEMKCIYGHR